MSKNVIIKQFNGTNYEEIYPKTTPQQSGSLSTEGGTISGNLIVNQNLTVQQNASILQNLSIPNQPVDNNSAVNKLYCDNAIDTKTKDNLKISKEKVYETIQSPLRQVPEYYAQSDNVFCWVSLIDSSFKIYYTKDRITFLEGSIDAFPTNF